MQRREPGGRGERGAAMVEMALVMPLLLMLVFGIIEFGIAFNNRLTVGNATQSAARVGSAIGTGPRADIEVLNALEQGLFQLPNNGKDIIKEVWVYKADATGAPASSCPGSVCNVYSYDPTLSCRWTPCPDPDPPTNYTFPAPGTQWDPATRNATVGSLDVLGVRIYFSHTWIVGSFLPLTDVTCTNPPNGCWEDTALMRLEPQQFGLGG